MSIQQEFTASISKYVLRVDNGDGYENIWFGDDIEEGIYYRGVAIKHWGKEVVTLLPTENQY